MFAVILFNLLIFCAQLSIARELGFNTTDLLSVLRKPSKILDYRVNIFLFYFGKGKAEARWPRSMRLFLYFARYQATHVTYSILTDLKDFTPFSDLVPANVRLITTTLSEITQAVNSFHSPELMASGISPSKISISEGYKVCDYRVLFCELFGDVLGTGSGSASGSNSSAMFTHWGWADMDNIFGNPVSPVLFPSSGRSSSADAFTRDVLAADSVHLTNGPFTVLRLNTKTCEMYKHIPQFWEMLSARKTQFLEEKSLVRAINQQAAVRNLTVYRPGKSLECGDEFVWFDGTLFDLKSQTECYYFHFGGGHGRRMRVVGTPLLNAFDDFLAYGYDWSSAMTSIARGTDNSNVIRDNTIGLIGNIGHNNYFFQVNENRVTLLPGGAVAPNASKGECEFILGGLLSRTITPFLQHMRKHGGKY